MIKEIHSVGLAFLCFIAWQSLSAQSFKKLNNDTVIWQSNYTLTMADFKGKVPANKALGGQVMSGIVFFVREREGTPYFVIEALIVKSKSFIRDSSLYALNHEQMHFNITEIFARKLRMRLTKLNFAKVSNIQRKLQEQYDKIGAELSAYQDRYDRETEHGQNPTKQKIWNEKIMLERTELNEFESTEVNLYK
jgi:hypothetical protein